MTGQCYVPAGAGIVAGALIQRYDEVSDRGRQSSRGVRLAHQPPDGVRPFAPASGLDTSAGHRPLCEQLDPELFYAEGRKERDQAKAACLACPMREECLEDALANDERYGVRGGLDATERRRVRRKREGWTRAV